MGKPMDKNYEFTAGQLADSHLAKSLEILRSGLRTTGG